MASTTSGRNIAEELRSFQESARVLSDDATILEDYSGEWVGVFEGAVRASGQTLDEVLEGLADQGIPPERSVIRFINPDPVTMLF